MATIPAQEPKSIRSGDTIVWTKSLPEYLAADWTLKYRIIGNAGDPLEVEATEDADVYEVTIPAADSAGLGEGIYTLIGWVEKDDDRYTIYEDRLTVKPDLAAVSGAVDTRTHDERTLKLIEDAIERYAVTPLESIVINGRQITRPSLKLLYQLRSKYAKLVRNQRPKKIVASFPRVR